MAFPLASPYRRQGFDPEILPDIPSTMSKYPWDDGGDDDSLHVLKIDPVTEEKVRRESPTHSRFFLSLSGFSSDRPTLRSYTLTTVFRIPHINHKQHRFSSLPSHVIPNRLSEGSHTAHPPRQPVFAFRHPVSGGAPHRNRYPWHTLQNVSKRSHGHPSPAKVARSFQALRMGVVPSFKKVSYQFSNWLKRWLTNSFRRIACPIPVSGR